MTSKEKKILLRLLEMYRDMPHLWDYNHSEYKIKKKREEGQRALLQVYKELEPDANIRAVFNKIRNIRTSYIREFKKVLASQRLSSNSKDWHKPTLWYYDHMSFLGDIADKNLGMEVKHRATHLPYSVHERRRSSGLDEKKSDNEASENNPLSTTDSHPDSDSETELELEPAIKLEPSTWSPSTSTLSTSTRDIRVISQALAVQMKGLDPLQMTIAQKLMFDVLFYAKLGRLTEDSYVANQSDSRKVPL